MLYPLRTRAHTRTRGEPEGKHVPILTPDESPLMSPGQPRASDLPYSSVSYSIALPMTKSEAKRVVEKALGKYGMPSTEVADAAERSETLRSALMSVMTQWAARDAERRGRLTTRDVGYAMRSLGVAAVRGKNHCSWWVATQRRQA